MGLDAERQAAWDGDARRSVHPRSKALLVLGLAAVLMVALLVVARARGDGDIVALGSSPNSFSTIPPPAADTVTGDLLSEGSQVIAPGDSIAPGVRSATDPAAAGAADPAAAAAGPAAAAAAGEAAAGGADLGVGGGVGDTSGAAGSGLPVITTRPPRSGGGGGGATTTQPAPANPTTTIPGQPPPPPSCSVTGALARPSSAVLRGQSGKLDVDIVTVEFGQTGCGSGFRAQVAGKDVPASESAGLFVATIPTSGGSWRVGSNPILIRSSAGIIIATIPFDVS